MTEFFAMGGYGLYVWGAYLVTAIAVIAEILSVRSKRRATLAEARLVAPTELGE
jgi:heme exporter protein D